MKKNISAISVHGFTLIELLVVIAIIGVLSSVVLSSLSTARSKGGDAAGKAAFATLRTQSELNYDALGNRYNTTAGTISSNACSTVNTAGTIFADTIVNRALLSIKTNNQGTDSDCGITASGNAYSVAGKLQSGAFWCIDSTGLARGKTAGGTVYTAIVAASTGAHVNSGDTVCQ